MSSQPTLRSVVRAHMPGLDGLRGSMLLLVLTAHFYFKMPGASGAVDNFIFHLRESGWVALDVFFVMSGFLITGILLDSKGREHFFRNFYVRRFLRIFPIYYAFLFVVFVVIPRLNVVDPAGIPPLLEVQEWYWSYLTNFLVATTQDPPNSLVAYTRHLWSLAVEEQFYLIWPLVVYLCGPRRLVHFCVAMIVGALVFRCAAVAMDVNPRAIYVLTFSRMDALATGSLLAVVARMPGGLDVLIRWARPAALAVALLGVGVIVATGEFSAFRAPMQSVGYSIVALGAAGLVIIAATAPGDTLAGRFFQNRILIQLGTYSYATYVTHTFTYLVIQQQFPWIHRLPLVGGLGWPASMALVVFLSAASILVGFLSWHLYEKHFLKLKDYFAYSTPREPLPIPDAASTAALAAPVAPAVTTRSD